MIEVKRIERIAWRDHFSETAHRLAFGEEKPKEWDRIDFALLGLVESKPSGYMTCREMSHDTVYWQYGGVLGGELGGLPRGTIWSFRLYEAFLSWHKARYSRCLTYIDNGNKAMLRMAAKVGFKIIGVRNYHKDVLLEHLLEFKE